MGSMGRNDAGTQARNQGVTRRTLLRSTLGAASLVVAPAIVRSARAQSGQVVVRTSGGSYEDALKKAVFDPFTQETGIEVTSYPTNIAKLVAMLKSGNIEIDVADLGEFTTVTFQQIDALMKLDRSKFTRTHLVEIEPTRDYYVGENTYGTVLAYNKESFPQKHPASWAEFWDVAAFPGARMLEDMAAEYPNLEFALLADGVALDKLYPLDVPRAFKKLREIRSNITKWWDTGAVSAEMLATKQTVLGSAWNGRVQVLVDSRAPVAIEWNQAARQLQTLCIFKGAANVDAAHQYIDFALQPERQAEVARLTGYGPINRKAFDFLDAETTAKMPTAPEHMKTGYTTDAAWWVANRKDVAAQWQSFLLGD
jgi:putative spermidine/putrescine transport system substrate-binding protein